MADNSSLDYNQTQLGQPQQLNQPQAQPTSQGQVSNNQPNIFEEEKNFVKNFITAIKQSPSTKPITTGNPVLDYGLQSKLSQKIPFVGAIVKGLNVGNNIIGPNIARTHKALAESCFCDYYEDK